MTENFNSQIKNLWKTGRRYISLQIDYGKLTLAEKLTMLFSGLLIVLVCVILGAFAVGFLAFALVDVLQSVMSVPAAYIVVAFVFMLLIAIVIAARRTLIVNPIARFISKLFFDKKL